MSKDHALKLTRLAARTFLAIALTLSAANLPAQDARKVISNPVPPYPEVSKKFRLSGGVKVQVVIAADGHINRFGRSAVIRCSLMQPKRH